MYAFILVQWRLGKLTEDQVRGYAEKGHITEDQAEEIFNTPKTN